MLASFNVGIKVALKTPIKLKVYPSIVKNGDVLTVGMAGTSGNTVDLDVVNMKGIAFTFLNQCHAAHAKVNHTHST